MNNQSVKPFSEPKGKAVIIGGGLAGMVVADQLLKAGMQVLIIEKSPRMGGKAGADRINSSNSACHTRRANTSVADLLMFSFEPLRA